MLEVTNKNNENGTLVDIITNKDVFIGVSAPNMVTKEMVSTMKEKSNRICHGKSYSRKYSLMKQS